jgi:hypothetical protein
LKLAFLVAFHDGFFQKRPRPPDLPWGQRAIVDARNMLLLSFFSLENQKLLGQEENKIK